MLLELDQNAFAEAVGVSVNTIRKMEACGADPVAGFASTRNKVREALNTMGIEFIDGGTPGVILRHKDMAAAGKSTGQTQ